MRPTRAAVLGALLGAGGAGASYVLATISGQPVPYVILLVLAVGLVGVSLGAVASLYAYIAASLVLILTSGQPHPGTSVVSDVIRFGAFVVGSPLVIVLALRAERERARMQSAIDASAAAERRLESEREAANVARQEGAQALRTAQRDRARLEEVAEAIPEPLVVVDERGRGTFANRAALRLYGRSFVERSPEEWGRMTNPRDEHGMAVPLSDYPQVAAQRAPLRARLTVRVPTSGREVLMDVEGTPIPGGGAVLLIRDVGREEDERRRLSRFASYVAHELRNPLAVARARIELAQREGQNPERAGAHALRALESVEAAIAVLERLEMYSRADAGLVEAAREPFDLRSALDASIERLRARGSERRVRVAVRGRPRPLGDQRLAEQAITNLLTNADRYSTADGSIRIDVQDGEAVLVRIADEGPGIADAVAERLFRDRVTAGRGLGLGLFLVRAMMEAQGGSVQLEERRPAAVFALRWQKVEPGTTSEVPAG